MGTNGNTDTSININDNKHSSDSGGRRGCQKALGGAAGNCGSCTGHDGACEEGCGSCKVIGRPPNGLGLASGETLVSSVRCFGLFFWPERRLDGAGSFMLEVGEDVGPVEDAALRSR